MATKTEAAKALVYEASYLADAGKPFSKEAAMCKLNAAEKRKIRYEPGSADPRWIWIHEGLPSGTYVQRC